MPRSLPLFPLNIVVFPGEKLNLHIFEPRYKQLIQDCSEQKSTFGMPSFLGNAVTTLGTELELLSIENTYASGELDIKTKGTRVFKINSLYRQMPGKPYAGAEIEEVEEVNDEDPQVKALLVQALEKLYEAMRINSLFITPTSGFRAYDIGHHVGLSVAEEYQLLRFGKESERQQFLLNHLQRIIPIVTETERLKERIEQNGHFKHLLPPSF